MHYKIILTRCLVIYGHVLFIGKRECLYLLDINGCIKHERNIVVSNSFLHIFSSLNCTWKSYLLSWAATKNCMKIIVDQFEACWWHRLGGCPAVIPLTWWQVSWWLAIPLAWWQASWLQALVQATCADCTWSTLLEQIAPWVVQYLCNHKAASLR